MTPTIEFIFDFASPNAYFAYRALPPILERTGAKLDINPCLLGGIFKATGNKAPMLAFAPIKGKLEYEMLEIKRFAVRHKLDKYRLNPHFPVISLMLMRAYIAARAAGVGPAFLEMGLRGMWEDGLKLDDPEVLKGAIDAAGLEFGEPARRRANRSGQADARRQHRGRGRARRVRRSDIFRGQGNVLRQGASRPGRGGGRGGEGRGLKRSGAKAFRPGLRRRRSECLLAGGFLPRVPVRRS